MDHQSQAYMKAKEKVERLKDFYSHLIVYGLVNTLLFVINMVTNPDYWWFLYALGGWGIGIIIHGLSIKDNHFLGAKWEEKKIKEYMEKDRDNDSQ
ncbi:2TM domain-containing protein [Lentibacillus halophilus]|uniref:2TM domain-containing protein n=1 Tax=Lentibacillus halophilus TaxID=295065 RepID=A0ABN0ZAK8_9BACI